MRIFSATLRWSRQQRARWTGCRVSTLKGSSVGSVHVRNCVYSNLYVCTCAHTHAFRADQIVHRWSMVQTGKSPHDGHHNRQKVSIKGPLVGTMHPASDATTCLGDQRCHPHLASKPWRTTLSKCCVDLAFELQEVEPSGLSLSQNGYGVDVSKFYATVRL